jgi:uncharacterized membrane protein
LTELSLSLSMAFGAISLATTQTLPTRWFTGILLVSMGYAIYLGSLGLRECVHELRCEGKIDELEGWNGIFYQNPHDERLWVPKITGLGYTVNFAHPAAWPVFLGALLPALIGLAFAVWRVYR